MKWLFIFASVFGLFVFSIYALGDSKSNDAYYYNYVTEEYENVNDNGSSIFWDKCVTITRYFIECASDSFNTIKTFNVSESSLAARFFSNTFINILMLPINYAVNLYSFFVKTFNLFVTEPIADTSHGGGGGGFHGGR